MMQRDESRHDFAFIAGVIVGAITGALATLALTPLSGPETREKLRERAEDLGPVKERAATVAGTAQHLVATGRERATELAAKAPLSIPGRHDDTATTDEHSEKDTMMAENPSSTGSGANQPRVHPEEPAEGRPDVPPQGAGTDGAVPTRASQGSGRTPHPSDPAEGRPDIPPPAKDKPESGSDGA